MKLSWVFFGAILACLGWAAFGHAESISWSFISRDMEALGPRQGGMPGVLNSTDIRQRGTVNFNLDVPSPQPFTGSADLVAFRLSKFAVKLDEFDDDTSVLNKDRYRLTLGLRDEASGALGNFSFVGSLEGFFSETTFDAVNTFESPTSQALRLGDNVYTVSIGPFVPPGPTNDLQGSIGAHVEVGPADVQESPEPSSLVLAGLGVAAACGAGLRRLRRSRRTTPTA